MVDTIKIRKCDYCYVQVQAEPSTIQELRDALTFRVPGAQFMPAYKNKVWDGTIKLVSPVGMVPAGLAPRIMKFAKERDYQVELGEGVLNHTPYDDQQIVAFIEGLNLPFKPRRYQLEAFLHAVQYNRAILLSPTASGKSLIIYLIASFFHKKNVLLIVPTTSLVYQMKSDFESYGCTEDIHIIMGGFEKVSDQRITISTWQSIYKMPASFFKKFDVLIGDEAHLFKAKSLESIMNKMPHVKHRYGLTGTLDGTQVHQLVLEGLFGPVKKVVSTAELIEQKHLADFKIKCIVLKHDESIRKQMVKKDYQNEMKYLVQSDPRNNFIARLTASLEGNSLVLFNYIEHGKILHEKIKKLAGNRHVFIVYGNTDAEAREEVRRIMEKEDGAIVVASYGTFSTGVNIKNLHNVVFSSPTKSKIRSLQSIGRGLRKGDTKDKACLYDISDDLSKGSWTNHTLKHFEERLRIYIDEGFEYKIYKIDLKGGS